MVGECPRITLEWDAAFRGALGVTCNWLKDGGELGDTVMGHRTHSTEWILESLGSFAGTMPDGIYENVRRVLKLAHRGNVAPEDRSYAGAAAALLAIMQERKTT